MPKNSVPLNRALSKLGILSRSQATEAIRSGRVRVNGRVVNDPSTLVVPESARIAVDGAIRRKVAWRVLLLHKPRGVVTTRHDPQGRRTIYDVLGEEGRGLIAVGRLDLATSGLLLLTNDTQLAERMTNPASNVPRIYAVTVRGRVTPEDADRLGTGIMSGHDRLAAHDVSIRKSSARETHLTIELREGKYREVRRLFEAIGHEATRLKRIRFGGLELGRLQPGEWREVSREEIDRAFAGPFDSRQ